ncbi:MAG: hypothetical protein IPH60_08615 [Flavobacteriales bacterium]|nr:hypothetical protein [Flavobacteriales bacterium]
MKRHTSEEEVYVTVEELLGEGQMKSGANGIPFAYTEYEDTQLHDVTFYLHDHLGNMRVTYTTGCTPAHPPTPGSAPLRWSTRRTTTPTVPSCGKWYTPPRRST